MTIANNFITDNITPGYGGGIYCGAGASPAIINNTIRGNHAGRGGGAISCDYSSATVINNAIVGNTSSAGGGGVFCSSCSPLITNNTIAGNAAPYEGGGIYCYSSSPTIINTVISDNSSGIYADANSLPSVRHSCVFGNGTYDFSGTGDLGGTNGNVAADPLLAAPGYGNVHIQPTSPCVDAGDDSLLQQGWVDMDGQPRPLGSHLDIGADESDGTLWSSAPSIVVRVAPEGDDANDGSSWALAKRTVQAGIDTVSQAQGDVWVKRGTYVGQVNLGNFVHVYGGFAGTEALRLQRNWCANATVLDGNQTGSVVTVTGAYRTSTIDGFTIRDGSGTLSSSHRLGGGVYCKNGSPMIAHNTITRNSASDGGGLYISYSAPVITDNTITSNSASYGGGISCFGSTTIVANNTICGNNASHDGGGIDVCYSIATVSGTVVAFNSSGIEKDGTGATACYYNCVYGNAAYDYYGLPDPTGTGGNLSMDPLFALSPDSGPDGIWATLDDIPGDLHLGVGSPCINVGDPAYVPAAGETDIDGQQRVFYGRVDIGADEFFPDADINNDRYVNVGDLQALIAAWGSSLGGVHWNPNADLDGDLYVTVADLQILVPNWGRSL